MKYIFSVVFVYTLFILGISDNIFSQEPYKPIPKVITPVYFDVSPPLRDMAANPPRKTDMTWKDGIVKNVFNIRKPPPDTVFNARTMDPGFQLMPGLIPTVTPIINYDGINNLTGVLPPDTYGDVGFDYYFQVVNCKFAIYNKTGTLLLGPLDNSIIWNGLPMNSNDGDAVVLFDEVANRWLFSQFSLPNYPYAPFYQMVAISQTADPTGSWYRWEFEFDDMPDYPKIGVWPDGYYLSINRFASGTGTWAGVGAAVFDRTAMLAGNASPQGILFTLPNSGADWSLLPSDCDGTFPSAGTPNYFTYLYDGNGPSDQLRMYEFHTDWTTPSNSTFGNLLSLGVNTFTANVTGIPQPGTTVKLDPINDRLMYREQYRKFADRQSMVLCHTIDASSATGIRWYELRKTTGPWAIYQQGTYSPDGSYRWMGSIAQDVNGNIALGYSVASGTIYPSVLFTGRLNGDAVNTMTIAESNIVTGSGSQTYDDPSRPSRWGDYSSMVTDPSVPNTFWYTQEYYTTTSNASWRTRIAEFQIGTVPFTAEFTANNVFPLVNSTVNFTDLSVGSPTGWSWSFTPATVTYVGGTSSSSQNPQVQFTSNGPYSVSLTATKPGNSNTRTKTEFIHAGTPGLWTGITSTDWNTSSNWHNYILPSVTTDVTIPTSAPNWPVFPSGLVLGSQIKNLTLTGNGQLNVNGSLNINNGYTLSMGGSGYLGVQGDWNDYGSFSAGSGTVEFTGASTSKITGGANPPFLTGYQRTTFTKSMTPLSGGSAGPTGDEGNLVVPIGFNFIYTGVTYSQVNICANGWISLDQSTSYDGYYNPYLFLPNTPNTTLAPWWDDLDATGGNIYYKTEGSAPNRIFTVEWNNVMAYYTGSGIRLNFQVKLYETTNTIEFCYGSVTGTGPSASESASIGIEDAIGGSGYFIEATTGSMTTGVTNLKSTVNWPTVNYRFAPATLGTETFYNLFFNKTSSSVSIERNLLINGEFHLKP